MKDIEERNGVYWQRKLVGDRGFKRWMETFPTTYATLKWLGLLVSYKIYRMTYSYFNRQKNFLIIYQKKKFKKHILGTTMASMVLVELPNIIGAMLGVVSLQFNQQVAWAIVDVFFVSALIIMLSLCEIAIIDRIMKT
jgi:hypothetical protein